MRLWRYINILSLDIAAGAVIGCGFFAQILGIVLLPHALLSLGLIVWIIYTADHLMDVRRSRGELATDRHRFHQQYFRQLSVAVIVALTVVALEAFFVRRPVLLAGVGLAMPVLGYLLLQSRMKFLKEFAGAALYTAGIVAAPWSLLNRPLNEAEWAIILLFATIAFLNLVLFAWFDRVNDERNGYVSLATFFGERIARRVIASTFIIASVMAITILVRHPSHSTAACVLLAMNGLLFATYWFRDFFGYGDRYRVVGDFTFLLPGIYLLASAWS